LVIFPCNPSSGSGAENAVFPSSPSSFIALHSSAHVSLQ
jgi:hypothetical protein